MKAKNKKQLHQPRAKRVPELKKGRYTDGHPLDELQYLECKLILTGARRNTLPHQPDSYEAGVGG